MTRSDRLAVLVVVGMATAAGTITRAQQAAVPVPQGLSSRRTTAVTYDASRTTKVDMIGTPLLPRARGEAQIKTDASGPVLIKAKMKSLGAPGQFGAEYLTYVLWAIPPQGRPKNLGELRTDEGESDIVATSDVQTFALIATAEPYYAVTTPSDVVVAENVVREDTQGRTSMTTLQHEIMPRGSYVTAAGGTYSLPPFNKTEPPDVQQARNAVAIARLAQAETYAAVNFSTSQRLLAQTEDLVAKGQKRDIISMARAAVQAAEETRLQATAGRLAAEQAAARAEATAREQAARDRAAQEAAARQAAELERQRAEEVARQATLDRQQAEQLRAEAERARAEAQAQAARAEALRAEAEQEKGTLRSTLLKQFSAILDTHDTPRGLIVNIGDVLFETGHYELKPAAREKLARFSGLVLAHPGLVIRSEGFTDSTGTPATNEKLSQQRADIVAQFLLSQGLPPDRVAAKGYGPAYPVATNDTRDGRSQNRRVELVVSGDVIGTPIGGATTR
jgi:outer membrane protein OmpA-like peptidoglycan-associated protein